MGRVVSERARRPVGVRRAWVLQVRTMPRTCAAVCDREPSPSLDFARSTEPLSRARPAQGRGRVGMIKLYDFVVRDVNTLSGLEPESPP